MCQCVFGWVLNLPVPINFVCYFVTYMYVHLHLAPSTIATYLSAISFLHKINNHCDPCENFAVHKLLVGVSKLHTTHKQTRLPITLPILHKLVCALPSLEPVSYKMSMYRAMFLFAFHACCRVGEITKSGSAQHWLLLKNIVFSTDSFNVTFTSYKHHVPGHTPTIRVHAQNNNFCPVHALKAYLYYRGNLPGPLFCLSDGQPIPRSHFANMLNQCLRFAGLYSPQLTSHSFRVGRATMALEQGMTLQQLLLLGRWKSMSALTKYLKPDLLHV